MVSNFYLKYKKCDWSYLRNILVPMQWQACDIDFDSTRPILGSKSAPSEADFFFWAVIF